MAAGEPAAPVWCALSSAADSADECRNYLQNALEADPLHDLARWELARLNAAHSQPNVSRLLLRRTMQALRRAARLLEEIRARSLPAQGGPESKDTTCWCPVLPLPAGVITVFRVVTGSHTYQRSHHDLKSIAALKRVSDNPSQDDAYAARLRLQADDAVEQ